MIPPVPAKILVGISLNAEESKELLFWAVNVLAQPNDTVVALHVLAAEDNKKPVERKKEENNKWLSIPLYQKQIRQAKAFAISIMGEFVETCQSKQVNLEARVSFSTSVGRGLIKEAKNIPADFLLICGKRNCSNKLPCRIRRFCCEHVPDGCSLVLVGKNRQLEQGFKSNSVHGDFHQSSSRWLEKDSQMSNFASSDDESVSKSEREKGSPRTVLEACERESQSTEEDASGFEESIITKSPVAPELKGELSRKPMSPLKRFSSFLFSSFDLNARKRNDVFYNKEKYQPGFKCFNYEQIANATKYFHPDNLVGQGGYSEVYRGNLDDGSTIAVKCLIRDSTNAEKEKEFLLELGIIGHVNHPNTASLLGCCVENGLYLIFKFYPKGTLDSALHGNPGKLLEWPVRYRIALGIARGLHYLHKCCKHRIIHRDIKASNVLLGPDYEPQISDFGLAKWLPNKWTHHAVIPIEGTFGYLAPEYFINGIVDEKTDVFAFGILLLEIITGRLPIDSSKRHLLLWVKPLMESGKLNELVDPKLEDKYDMDQLHRLVLTASYCIRQTSISRPSMTEVLEMLTNGIDSKVARSWRIPKFTSDEMDDYSMIYGYEVPSDITLDDL